MKVRLGKRISFLLLLIITIVVCFDYAGLREADLTPDENGMALTKQFFSTALEPALDYKDKPEYAPPYHEKIFKALWLTVKYACCAISLALPIGILFGTLASNSWWKNRPKGRRFYYPLSILRRLVKLYIAAGRSIHEILLAMLLITALGTSPFAILLALAIPYGSTLAKVFAEILDEQNPKTKDFLISQGGGGLASWLFTIIPKAFPDLVSYTMYRFECAIRSAAILGFVGIPTIGYHIQTAMGDYNVNEIWTLIYVLLGTIICFEMMSDGIRYLINKENVSEKPDKTDLKSLRSARPRGLLLKIIVILLAAFITFSWWQGEPLFSDVPWEKRKENLERFLNKEITPYPVQQSGDWAEAWPWAKALFEEKGITAIAQTLCIATAAIILAFLASLISLPMSTKSINRPRPFEVCSGRSPFSHVRRFISALFLRLCYVVTRAMPEFLLAFILVQLFSHTVWPLILALAIHNFGIIGRLGGELIDNNSLQAAKIQIIHGGSRISTYLFSILPENFNRFLLYFFYRWETCIRDATVLGILGIPSLGFLISDTRSRDHNDEMFFYILLGASIVMIGDILSDIVRSRLRKA